MKITSRETEIDGELKKNKIGCAGRVQNSHEYILAVVHRLQSDLLGYNFGHEIEITVIFGVCMCVCAIF